MKYIQSFYQYPVTFSSIGKTMPSKFAQGETKNIMEVSEAQVEILERSEPLYRELLKSKKIRVLNKLPESYKAPADQINEARSEADKLRAENAELAAKLAAYEAAQTKAGDADNGDVEIEPGVTATNEVGENPDFDKMDYKELQAVGKKLGIKVNGVSKADLLAQIKDAVAK